MAVSKRKLKQKVTDLNLMLDHVVGYLNSSGPVIERNLQEMARKVAECKGFNQFHVDSLKNAVNHHNRFIAVSELVSRPIEKRADGLYYTGEDR